MKTASVAQVKAQLSDYLDASSEGPVVVTRNGKPVAVLLAVDDEEELERLVLAHSRKFRAILDASRQQIRAGKSIRHKDLWKRVKAKNGATTPRKRRRSPPKS